MLNFEKGHLCLLWIIVVTVVHTEANYVCPKDFTLIGKKCYYFSNDEATWFSSHFKCLSLNSSLAIITKPKQELHVRRYLNRHIQGRYEHWLGGQFNEKKGKWVWGINGKPLTFHGFSRMNPNNKTKWVWHCIILDPKRQNKWGAKECVEVKHYICLKPANFQRKSKKVKNKNVGLMAPGYLKVKPRQQRYYLTTFICPQHMILVGRKCYFFSLNKASWSNAYWACRDNGTNLAIITSRIQDNILRGFLNGNFTEKHERWIGGIYDWKQQQWKWAKSGRIIKYQNFLKTVGEKDHTQHCITLDPKINNIWNSKDRLEEKHYICQARSKSVVKYEKFSKFREPEATVIVNVENATLANIVAT